MFESEKEEFYYIMGELQRKFNEQLGKNTVQDKIYEKTESQNFYGKFHQFDVSSGRLIPGRNLVDDNGVAIVNQDLSFKIAVFPKHRSDVPPFRIDIDTHRSTDKGKVIHINDPYGEHYDIPSKIIDEISPDYAIDLVQISGTAACTEAIEKSIYFWNNE